MSDGNDTMSKASRHEYAVEECVDMQAFSRADLALRNALGCDAYPEEIQAARSAAIEMANQANRLAGQLRRLLDET